MTDEVSGGRPPFVVDTSFFPSSGAVNPALTAMANALRVGDHLIDRLGARRAESTEVVGSTT
jgi:choline dehydrogenase-like flavoprotein